MVAVPCSFRPPLAGEGGANLLGNTVSACGARACAPPTDRHGKRRATDLVKGEVRRRPARSQRQLEAGRQRQPAHQLCVSAWTRASTLAWHRWRRRRRDPPARSASLGRPAAMRSILTRAQSRPCRVSVTLTMPPPDTPVASIIGKLDPAASCMLRLHWPACFIIYRDSFTALRSSDRHRHGSRRPPGERRRACRSAALRPLPTATIAAPGKASQRSPAPKDSACAPRRWQLRIGSPPCCARAAGRAPRRLGDRDHPACPVSPVLAAAQLDWPGPPAPAAPGSNSTGPPRSAPRCTLLISWLARRMLARRSASSATTASKRQASAWPARPGAQRPAYRQAAAAARPEGAPAGCRSRSRGVGAARWTRRRAGAVVSPPAGAPVSSARRTNASGAGRSAA